MRKLVSLLLLVLVLISSTAQALTAPELLAKAESYQSKAKSFEAAAVYNLVMQIEGTQMNTTFKSSMKFILNPLRVKAAMQNDLAGETALYMQKEGDTLAIYTVMGKAVGKSAMPYSFENAAAAAGLTTNSAYSNVSYVGTEKLNGKNVHVLSATTDVSWTQGALGDIISSTGAQAGSSNALSKVPVKLYIDAKTNAFIRTEIDMTTVMNELLGAAGGGIKIVSYTCVMDYKNYNKVKTFKIPADVIKNAVSY